MAERPSLQNDPRFQPFALVNARPTGQKLGSGSFGSVVELTSDGVVCAGKTFHEALVDERNVGAEVMVQKYVGELELMSSLRHPHLVQFMGVCFLDTAASSLPVIVMEKLETNLDYLLENNRDIPLDLKRSILADVCKGLAYLHNHRPQVIHRDLSAKNVLLNSAMVAKISDLGNALIIDIRLARNSLSSVPGQALYMPPESFDDKSCSYNTSLDMFSLGHLALFTITQVFPKTLRSATYTDPDDPGKVLGRSEVERRKEYIDQLHQQLGEEHPLAQMVKQCLHNDPPRRPTAEEVLQQLEETRSQIKNPYQDLTRLEMIRMLEQKDNELRQPLNTPQRGDDGGNGQQLLALGRMVIKGIPILMLIAVLIATAGVLVAVLLSTVGPMVMEQQPTVNKPLDEPEVVCNEWMTDSVYRDRQWGTYRSNVYFGVRSRVPQSLVSGAMWFIYNDGNRSTTTLRHTCEQSHDLQTYGWVRHDGTTFGQQGIFDHGLKLTTEFITQGGLGDTWTARFTGQSLIQKPILVSLILYVFNEGLGDMVFHPSQEGSIYEVHGWTPEHSRFRVRFKNQSHSADIVHNYLLATRPNIADLTHFMATVLSRGTGSLYKDGRLMFQLPGNVDGPNGKKSKPNLVAYQITTLLPFEIDMVFEMGTFGPELSISGEKFSNAIRSKERQFDQRFENTFQLKAKGFKDSEVVFAKAAFSDLIGGISYFYGSSIVTSSELSEPVVYLENALYTAVPSRSYYPRGFMWDEGFHQMIVTHWDITIVKDVLAHWMDLINVEGWIPREQILGLEAQSKVPNEYIVQHNENANPPTFFLTLETLISHMQREHKMDYVFLRRMFPRLKAWFQWFNTTQAGARGTTFRWRGRNATTARELNPKTMTSGLDDYPRATHPSYEEYHVDLRCWMAIASKVMAKIANILEVLPEFAVNTQVYNSQYKALTDQTLLDNLHWDPRQKAYSDWGLHGYVKLETVKPKKPEETFTPYTIRATTTKQTLRFVDTFGYVNLFPFLLRIVSPMSENLGHILDQLRNKSLLWTEYGLRSLAKEDRFYNKYNTEHDHPVWRGPIWINMNYLAVRALHYYGNSDGPYRELARKLYQELRFNLIRNMHDQFMKTGYIWAQYDDRTGAGKGAHPFTGWSSLIVLIMAEKYD